MDDGEEIIWEHVVEAAVIRRRVGRSKSTGVLLIEAVCDACGREIEKKFYDDDGTLSKRTLYEYDDERRPKLVLGYDRNGKLVWRQERGKRPEQF
jgi:hypothetical protein